MIFLGGGVPPGPENPYPISENIRYTIFHTLFQTWLSKCIPYFRPCDVWQFWQLWIDLRRMGLHGTSRRPKRCSCFFFLRDQCPRQHTLLYRLQNGWNAFFADFVCLRWNAWKRKLMYRFYCFEYGNAWSSLQEEITSLQHFLLDRVAKFTFLCFAQGQGFIQSTEPPYPNSFITRPLSLPNPPTHPSPGLCRKFGVIR